MSHGVFGPSPKVGLFRWIAVADLPTTLASESSSAASWSGGLMATTGPVKVGAHGGGVGGFHVLVNVIIVGDIAGLFGFLAFHLE